jgi:hypothetical protein
VSRLRHALLLFSLLPFCVAFALAVGAGCDGGQGLSTSQPIDDGTPDASVAEVGESSFVWAWQRVDLLDPESRLELCDWMNARQGGYGRSQRCATGVLTTDHDAAHCDQHLLALGACGVVTAQVEACVNVGESDLCASAADALCAKLTSCHP